MSGALEARPRLVDALEFVRRESQGNVQYVVKQTEEQKFFQFGESEVELMRLMDGRRSASEIAAEAGRALGLSVTAGQVADYVHRLKRLGIVARTPAERHLMLMERLRADRKIRARGRTSGSILRLRFSLGDPDELFDRVIRRISWLWSPAFVALSVALFLTYFAVVYSRWGEFWAGTQGMYSLSGFGAGDVALFFGLFILSGGIHELGHGLTTKYFGGEVHEIGAMLLYFSPALFCNTNDAWAFQKRSHRLWVSFAGPWIELVLAAFAALVWVLTEPGTLVHRISFLMVLLGGITSIVTNFNPLIPLDGYYVLSDWLEVSNLRARAFAYWGWLARRFLAGIDAPEPPVTPRERRIFLIYGGAAIVYSLLVMYLSFFWLISIFGRFVGPWIWPLVIFLVARGAHRQVARIREVGRAGVVSLRATLRNTGRRRLLLAGGAAAVLVLCLPWTYRARGEVVIEGAPRATVRAAVPGILSSVRVGEGDTVHAGEVLAEIWSPEAERRRLEARTAVDTLTLRRASAEAAGDRSAASEAAAALAGAREALATAERRAAARVVRAPLDGVVLSHRPEERLGERLAEGVPLFRIAGLGARVARVRVPLARSRDLATGQRADLKLPVRPALEFDSHVRTVAPAADGEWIEARVPLPVGGWLPPPGARGAAKIVTGHGTIAGALVRALRRTVRSDLWL